MTMTREDVLHVLGPVDDHLIVEILATGATREELEEAYAWLHANDVLGPQLRRQPTGKVAELCEILEGEEEEPDRM
ncbi:MAG: hypothetical protein DIU57_006275 [Pseudomonadota bacterium]|jgi:hypothetical protein|nr:MAG: hypothetical protein DIU57_10660 [Pseudomonadota bacterium]